MTTSIDQALDAYDRGTLSRRELLTVMLLATAGAGGVEALAQDAATPKPASTFTAVEVDHIALAVTDVPRSSAWYQKHLGLRVSRASQSNTFLDCGDNFVALFRSETPGLHHFSFGLKEYNVEDAVKRIEAAGMTPRREGGRVYFPDPDGIVVQVSQSRKEQS